MLNQILSDAVNEMQSTSWLEVLEAIGWDPASEENIPIPYNAVLTIQLDNREISGSSEVFRLNGKMNFSQFAWYRLKFIRPRATLLNYPNKGIAVGATTPNRAYFCLLMQNSLFVQNKKQAHILDVPTISNIVLAAVLDSALDIAQLYGENSSRISYEPNEFSGATFRPFAEERLSGCKANLFEQGAYTILGATSMRQAIAIAKLISELVQPYKRGTHWQRSHKVAERDEELRSVKRKLTGTLAESEAKRLKALQKLISDSTHKVTHSAEQNFEY